MSSEQWDERVLADLCGSIDYGYTASACSEPVGPKFLRITDIVSGHINWAGVPHCDVNRSDKEKYRLHDGDVVIARTGATTGASAYISNPPDSIFASYLVRLKIGSQADPRFISYFLKSATFWDYIGGVLGDKSAQPNASAKTMTQVKVSLPPIAEQQAIACILGSLDDKIELNRKMNETLEAMARAVFKSWFVDFDPVRAKAEGRRPYGMDDATVSLFPDSFEDSELGEIPKGWRVGKVNEIAELSRDSFSPNKFRNEVFDHYSIPAFDNGRLPVSEEGEQIKSNKYVIKPDSVLISKLNPDIQRVWNPSIRGDVRSICSTEFLVAHPKEQSAREYLYSFLSSSSFSDQFASLVTGTTGSHQRVQPDSFLDMPIVIPDPSTVKQYSLATEPMLTQVTSNRSQAATMAELRDALLPKLLSGETRVNA